MYGHWRVDFDEPACTPYWDQFKDKVRPDCPRNRYSFIYPDLRVVLLKARTDGYVSNMSLSVVPALKYVMQRIEARLENIRSGEDGKRLCASTPHDFYGRHFDHPDSCANPVSHIVACFVFSYLDSSIIRVCL